MREVASTEAPVVMAAETAAMTAALTAVRGHRVGRIVGGDAGGWLVDYPGNPHGPLPARTTMRADDVATAALGAEALLVFDEDRSDRPIVVGLLAPQASVAHAPAVEAVVDGERLVYTASRELVLRCGKASVTLTSDGAVRIRGTDVLSRASATNRIRGGNVQIN